MWWRSHVVMLKRLIPTTFVCRCLALRATSTAATVSLHACTLMFASTCHTLHQDGWHLVFDPLHPASRIDGIPYHTSTHDLTPLCHTDGGVFCEPMMDLIKTCSTLLEPGSTRIRIPGGCAWLGLALPLASMKERPAGLLAVVVGRLAWSLAHLLQSKAFPSCQLGVRHCQRPEA